MSPAGRHALAAAAILAAAAGAAYLLASGGAVNVSAQAGAAATAAGWQEDTAYPGQGHLCQPWHLAEAGQDRLGRRHPLFRRPDYPGCHGTRLIRGGWAWYLDPPSEDGP